MKEAIEPLFFLINLKGKIDEKWVKKGKKLK